MEAQPKSLRSKEELTKGGETGVEVNESLDIGVEKAKEIYSELKKYDGMDIVGREELDKVEGLAQSLTDLLKTIPLEVCLREGLPCLPAQEWSGKMTA